LIKQAPNSFWPYFVSNSWNPNSQHTKPTTQEWLLRNS